MADFVSPTGPPPPHVPEGWIARWNDQYKEWFYVNTFTKQSQWEKPTAPAIDPSQESPNGAPPGYTPGLSPAPTGDSKNNPFVNDASRPGNTPGAETDEALARRLQEEENTRSAGGGYGAGVGAGAGSSASYMNSPQPPQGYNPYPNNDPAAAAHGNRGGSSTDKAKGLLGKLLGGSKNKFGGGSHGGGYGQQSHGGGFGGHSSYGQPQYGGHGGGMGGGLGGLLASRGGHGGYGSHGGHGGYGGHGGGYGGYGGHGPPRKSGGGMGMAGGAALGLGAGALMGGAYMANQAHDQHEEQEAYQEGYQDGGGDDYGGGGDDFGGGDFGGE